MMRATVKVQTARLHGVQQQGGRAEADDLSRDVIRPLSPAIGWLICGLSATVLSATASVSPGLAQTPVTPDATEPAVEIPVESIETQPNSLTAPPGERSIQVPEIVPIPPQAVPTGPFAPLPGALPEGTSRGEDVYTLGAGDQIVLDVFDVPEFSAANGTYTVLVDGSVTLPWIGRVQLQGLTLDEASALLEREYGGRGYIVDPLITVNLAAARTLKVSVVGEVKRPGAYAVSPAGEADGPLTTGDTVGGTPVSRWPSVTEAIKAAGGITQLADLRNVQIRRPQRDGSQQLIDINLWELIRTGTLGEDITLRDGDTLVVPTAVALSPDEAILLGSASFAPETITVNVVGEVIAPGPIEIPPNTSLNQAIQAAGGFDRQRARTGRVTLVRLNPNGTAVQRRVEIDLAAGINEESNPALQPGDTVIIGRSGLVSTVDTLNTLLEPIGTVLGNFNDLSDLFGGND